MIPRLPLMRSGLSTPLSLSKRSIATFVEPPTRITTLPNRIRVATNDAPAHVQSITLMLAAAARYETDDTQGFGYLLTKLAMKSTLSRTPSDFALETQRNICSISSHEGRDVTLYQAAFPSQNIAPVFSLLTDTVLHPLLTPPEVEEVLDIAAWELKLFDEQHDEVLLQRLQNVGFGGKGLGRNPFPDAAKVDDVKSGAYTSEHLRAYRKKWFRPERMVVAGTGMEHESLVELVEKELGHLPFAGVLEEDGVSMSSSSSPSASSSPLSIPSAAPSTASSSSPPSSSSSSSSTFGSWISSLTSSPSSSSSSTSSASSSSPDLPANNKSFATLSESQLPPPPPKETDYISLEPVPPIDSPRTVYTGGVSIEERNDLDMQHTHLFIGFEGFGANDDDVFPLAVLQTLLGDGASFSSGGPGKGLLSRFYTGMMCGSYGIEAVGSHHLPYPDSGLIAFSLSCKPAYLEKHIRRLSFELSSLLTPTTHPIYPVHPIELSRARNRLKSLMLFQRENPRIECEDLAAQVLATGKRMPLAEMVAKIDGVEMDDLARVARKVFVEGVRGDAKRELTVVARGPRGVEGCKEMVKRAWTAQGLMTGSL